MEKRARLRSCLGVLFQIGKPLECAVKAILQHLGGTVEEPLKPGYCDCYLIVSIEGVDYRAVVEIKGASKAQFDMKGFRQLLQWRDEAKLERDEEYRPIFIGNSDIENPPEMRSDPFGNEWKKKTKSFKVAALTTTTLNNAYFALKNGELDTIKFWKAIFNTDGIFELDKSFCIAPKA